MKFRPLEDIKSRGRVFEAGNQYTSEKHGVADADIERWYANGWCEIDGRDPPPPRQVRGVVVQAQSTTHTHEEVNHG